MRFFRFLLFFVFYLSACKFKSNVPLLGASNDSSTYVFGKSVDSSLFAKTDGVLIGFPGFDSVTYSRGEFNDIIVHFPELYSSLIYDPDIVYYGSVFSGKIAKVDGFNSEAGQDQFYMLYAFFLRNKDTGRALAGARDTLIRIFEEINEILAN